MHTVRNLRLVFLLGSGRYPADVAHILGTDLEGLRRMIRAEWR